MKLIADEAQYRGRKSADQSLGAVGNGLEHRLHVGWRTGDDLEDFGGGGLTILRGTQLGL